MRSIPTSALLQIWAVYTVLLSQFLARHARMRAKSNIDSDEEDNDLDINTSPSARNDMFSPSTFLIVIQKGPALRGLADMFWCPPMMSHDDDFLLLFYPLMVQHPP